MSCLLSHFISLNSTLDMDIQIMAIAIRKVMASIMPLEILFRYICPKPQNRRDNKAAMIGREDLDVVCIKVKTLLHTPGDKKYP